ncbi:hypothetical protein NV63_18645, partial [Elizabethkingia anophelis]
GGFPPFWGEKGGPPKKFSPRGKNFPPGGKKFWGVFKNPQKGGPMHFSTYGLKTPGGFPPFGGKKGGPQKFSPGGKIFPRGEKFWGF